MKHRVGAAPGGRGHGPLFSTASGCALELADEAVDCEWEALARATGASPFMRPGWVRAWAAAFAPDQQLHLVVTRRGGLIVGLLPVLVDRRRARGPVNAETPRLEPLAVDEEAARGLLPALVSGERVADLQFLPSGGREQSLLAAARDQGNPHLRQVVRRSPRVHVDGDWDAYQAEVIGTSRLSNLRRRTRRLAERGSVTLETHDGSCHLEDLLEEGFGLEAAGWKGEGRAAVLARPDARSFYWSAARWARQEGLLRLHVLRLGDRAIAFSLNLEQDGVSYGLKTAYAEDLRPLAPGVMLVHRLLQDAFSRPEIHLFEMLGEDDEYKRSFSNGVQEQVRLRLFPGSVAGRIRHAGELGAQAAREEAKQRLAPDTRSRLLKLSERWRR